MSTKADQIMVLARALADVQVEHATAVREFSEDRADYEPVQVLAEKWVAAEKALRTAVEALEKGHE